MATTDSLNPSEAFESTANILENTVENVMGVAKDTAESTSSVVGALNLVMKTQNPLQKMENRETVVKKREICYSEKGEVHVE